MSTATGPEAAPKPSAKSIYEQRKRYSTVVMADVSQYPVNHLVTFCLGEDDGVHTVEDASRKLAVMDSQGRVWAQEMLLRVSPDHVTLLDPASKEELESYPLGAIVRCDAVMPPGRSRSLLLLVCQEPERAQPDVHFFQGLRLGAELIREDIQGALHNYRSGRGERRAAALRATQEELQRDRSPAAETPPLQRRPSVRAVISTVERGAGRGRPQAKPIPEAEEAQRPEPVGTSSNADSASPDLGPRGPDLAVLQAEREVDILNHVFDDVESFVSRLQKSAEAARVLEHRERGRRSRRRAAGEGLLTLRAKPPSEAEYTDVLQKIKYAFSLLARLRGNIADPSSPELLHFLFGPLQMIVNTSGGPEFASSVRRPHLTSDAVALLRDNVTPRENELWTSLGDSWTRPGLELSPEEGPPYRPEFFSGWEPPVTDPQSRAWEDPVEKQLQHERRRRQVTQATQQGRGWEVRGRGRSAWPRLTRLSYFLQQSAPQVAVNGHRDLEPESEPQLESETAGKWVLCNYDFQARNSSELSVKQRDVLEVLDDSRKWWKVRDPAGQEGYVPYNILTPYPGPRLHHSQSPARSLNSTPPPPPAPAPAPPPALARPRWDRPRWDSCDSLNGLDPSEKEKFSQMLIVNEELQARLAQGRSGPSRAVPGPRAPEPQLSPGSDASEVRAWLQAKGFSSGTVDALGVLTGAQLFSLQKEELRAVSPEEGARVYSQVTVQRSLLEDKEKVSELEAVMEKQKKKVEGEVEMEVI
ncbi:epidermal growth factor receptor kinase substrate 8-like protein 1 isoform X1 [Homo sapiens]|uniref:epidermal growth factor receptor kinase substrate 8-like protein 1 isoform X1 n=1 Tax=Homo sapiens TaxID=9606 RepID=UPI000387BF77|nr:epidermal growth factor receptor kinase substrate 8-like protein 1 isoform X1 [Homo sapiens]XP_047294977.1 epidermal growth factor receptor kinase substrate 8-like protein 1 isoform X1 [Homo sapiens]XP_054177314.1 epidermal growth factor receptor kinase substrate 8-like protein 1 isoform X1 [Homo sapiens]|eukprot:XP_005259077.1 epidermal growth factor receptor kinase substrate 8-like protein 1 isoform X1 [Homo sapiens]